MDKVHGYYETSRQSILQMGHATSHATGHATIFGHCMYSGQHYEKKKKNYTGVITHIFSLLVCFKMSSSSSSETAPESHASSSCKQKQSTHVTENADPLLPKNKKTKKTVNSLTNPNQTPHPAKDTSTTSFKVGRPLLKLKKLKMKIIFCGMHVPPAQATSWKLLIGVTMTTIPVVLTSWKLRIKNLRRLQKMD
jgi:hypothetical protein